MEPARSPLRRRTFLGTAGAFLLTAACTATPPESPSATRRPSPLPQADGQVRRFRSRPDLRPAATIVSTDSERKAPGLLFVDSHGGVGQQGPMILDADGELVWFKPLSDGPTPSRRAFTVRTQRYRGEPVLVWFEGAVVMAHGEGEWVIADTSYTEITRVRGGNGYVADLHEFLITERDTALLICYGTQQGDEPYFYGVVQEIDIATGEVVFQWRSDEHIPVSDSHKATPPPPGEPYDYFHLNSISEDADGTLILSARNTWALYKIDRASGDVLWTMGGRSSDFALPERARFAWQHHAVPRPDGTLTLFDNQAAPANADESRGLVLRLDEQTRTVGVVAEYRHPGTPILAGALGSFQVLGGDRVLVGFCQPAVFTEYTTDGEVLFDARLAGADTKTYRVFKSDWTGRPTDDPAVAIEADEADGDATRVAVSWNGATEVDRWRVLAGDRPDALSRATEAPRKGFETTIRVPGAPRHVAVEALDAEGTVLGRTPTRSLS